MVWDCQCCLQQRREFMPRFVRYLFCRDVGFSGKTAAVIRHALRLLEDDITVTEKDSEKETRVQPKLALPHVLNLTFYSNQVNKLKFVVSRRVIWSPSIKRTVIKVPNIAVLVSTVNLTSIKYFIVHSTKITGFWLDEKSTINPKLYSEGLHSMFLVVCHFWIEESILLKAHGFFFLLPNNELLMSCLLWNMLNSAWRSHWEAAATRCAATVTNPFLQFCWMHCK